jgi:hypothetical protein
MERGKGKEGKGKEAAVDDTQLAAPSAAGAAPDLSSGWGQTARYGWPVAAPASKKRAHETEAQMRRRKKKNQKTRERQERKAAGLKINSPDDVPTFEEFDSADPSEVNFSTSQPFFFCFTYHFFCTFGVVGKENRASWSWFLNQAMVQSGCLPLRLWPKHMHLHNSLEKLSKM